MDGERKRAGRGPSTRSVHAGEDRVKERFSLTTPIYQTSTYTFPCTQDLIDYKAGLREREEYGRYGNPTQRAAERKIADLEEGEDALLFSSGMAALATVWLTLLKPGQHLITTDDNYRGSRRLATSFLTRFGVEVAVAQAGNLDAIKAAIKENTQLIFVELPTNPHLYLIDLKGLAELGRGRRIRTLVDSTFATPYNVRPLSYGIDMVLHSATKYLGGHNDLMAGVVVGKKHLISLVRENQAILGGVADPHGAYLLIRGLKSFALRIERQNENAMRIASFLDAHPKVRKVNYPGLPNHPQHELATEMMQGFGGVITFEVDGDGEAASRFIDGLKIPFIAPSLGGTESLVEQPWLMSYTELSREDRYAIGIKDELVRLSVGIENIEDLIADLEQALALL